MPAGLLHPYDVHAIVPFLLTQKYSRILSERVRLLWKVARYAGTTSDLELILIMLYSPPLPDVPARVSVPPPVVEPSPSLSSDEHVSYSLNVVENYLLV